MIWQPRPGQRVRLNYKDKSMPHQGKEGKVVTVASGKGPRNVLIRLCDADRELSEWEYLFYEIIPRGNLVDRGET